MYLKNGNKILITADRACDIPKIYMSKYEIKYLDYYIINQYEEFSDTKEISGKALQDYISRSDDVVTLRVSSEKECEDFFRPLLDEYDEIVHICIGADYSQSYVNVEKVSTSYHNLYVINSKSITIGAGMVVCYAAEIASTCESVQDLVNKINEYTNKIILEIIISKHSKLLFSTIKYRTVFHKKLGENSRIQVHCGLWDYQKYFFIYKVVIKKIYIKKLIRNRKKNPQKAFYLLTSVPGNLENSYIKQLKDSNAFDTLYDVKPSSSSCLYLDRRTICIAYEVE